MGGHNAGFLSIPNLKPRLIFLALLAAVSATLPVGNASAQDASAPPPQAQQAPAGPAYAPETPEPAGISPAWHPVGYKLAARQVASHAVRA